MTQRERILGTAGHIDHGKTTLVKALTGVDCDRLPEEKARGITIDIGFAQLDLGDFQVGVVDVPGHERFVKNMLAGATGIDLALLVVAADDSVMPQTREHLDILRLLGITHGVIALTKADLVDDTTREVVELEIRELVRGSFLESAAIVATSAHTGLGIEELKAELHRLCTVVPPRAEAEWFRMPIDRAFVVQGYGTVVTGSVNSGRLAVGQEIAWHRADGTTELVRVRSLNNHGSPVPQVVRGQRAGINLAGVTHDAVMRGQELATPGYLLPSQTLTVRLTNLATSRRAIKHRLPVRLHLGTAEVTAKVSILDSDEIRPGQWVLAQLFLTDAVVAVWGQPFVIRDSSGEHTLGGGQVLQPCATKLRRRHLDSLEVVERLQSETPLVRAEAAAWFAEYHGFETPGLVRNAGVPPSQAETTLQELRDAGQLLELHRPPTFRRLLHARRVQQLEERLLGIVGRLHEEQLLLTNHDRPRALALCELTDDHDLLQAVVDRLLKAKKLTGDARRIAHSDFKPKLSVNQRKLKVRIVEAHAAAGFQPPEPSDFANLAGGNATALPDIYEVACAEGLLMRIAEGIYLHSEIHAEMHRLLNERLGTGVGATVAEIRDLLGTTRKYAIPICEYLDRQGVTRREGDLRYGQAVRGSEK